MKNTLVKNWFFGAGATLLLQVVNFVIIMKLTKALSVENFGVYTLVITTTSLFVSLLLPGLNIILVREISNKPAEINFFYYRLLPIALIYCILIVVAIYFYFNFIGLANIYILVVTWLIVSQIVSYQFFQSFSYAKQKIIFPSLLDLFSKLVFLGLVLSIPLNNSYIFVLYIYMIVDMIKSFILWIYQFKSKYFKREIEYSLNFRNYIKLQVPIFVLIVSAVICDRTSLLALSIYSDLTQISYFSLGNRIALPFQIAISSLLTALYPILSSGGNLNSVIMSNNLNNLFKFIGSLGIIVGFIFVLFGLDIVVLFFGNKYVEANRVLSFQIWTIIYSVINALIGTIMNSVYKTKQGSLLSLFSMLIFVPAILFCARYGAETLSIGILCANFVLFPVNLLVLHKSTKIKLPLPFFIGFQLMILFCCLLMNYFPKIDYLGKITFITVLSVAVVFYLKGFILEVIMKLKLR